MTDYNIYPYGQSAELPDGYPIADNLTTGSAQQALSARQGVRLNKLAGVAQDIVINCLGDSITEGWIGAGQGVNGFASPTWCEQMASNLGCTVNNYGLSATSICNGSSESFVTRLNRMTETTVDLLLIFGGTNDYGDTRAQTLGSIADAAAQGTNFYASFKYLVEAAINKYPSAVIAVITPMRRQTGSANSKGITIEQIVNAEIEVAEYYGIPCYDFFHDGGINPSISAQRTRYTADGLHPNQAGINKWLAPQFTKFAKDLLAMKAANQ